MDNQARLLAALSELSIDDLRLVELFVEFLTEKQAKESSGNPDANPG